MIIEEKILGLTLQQWHDMLECDEAEDVEKALAYLDGEQEEAMEELLSDPHKGRKDWKVRGIIPRFRNLVKPIVIHSGMLFKDSPPTLEVYDKNSKTVDENASNFLYEELSKTEFSEFCITLDETTRLLKSVLVLTQYDPQYNELTFTLLHRSNSAVVMDNNYRTILGLIYETSDDQYRIFTLDTIYDLTENDNDEIVLVGTQPNPYGIIPASPFYDTNLPRCGFWLCAGMDLVSANEIYNLHLTDAEYALSWAKLPTLYTNCRFNSSGSEELEIATQWGQKLPSLQPAQTGIIGGPGKAIILDSVGIDSPFVEYKAPVFDIAAMDAVVNNWIKNTAYDWSVQLDVAGQGRANSGFQLVVEELPNLELRKQRQKMFSMGFKRWYKIVAQVLNTVNNNTALPLDAELYVDFAEPILPVDQKVQEELWTVKIDTGRASLVDYFEETQGMTEEEALAKIAEINSYKNLLVVNSTNTINTPNNMTTN